MREGAFNNQTSLSISSVTSLPGGYPCWIQQHIKEHLIILEDQVSIRESGCLKQNMIANMATKILRPDYTFDDHVKTFLSFAIIEKIEYK